MGKAQSRVKAPDMQALGQQQQGANLNNALVNQQMNMMGQSNPYGSLSYEQVGTFKDPQTGREIPQYQQNVQLNDAQQGLLDANNQTKAGIAQYGNALANGLGDMPKPHQAELQMSVDGDFQAGRDRAEDALMQRMQPSIDQRRDRTEQRLASQGIRLGSPAYDAAMRQLSSAENDAQLATIAQAGQEQSRDFGQAMQSANFANDAQAKQQALGFDYGNQYLGQLGSSLGMSAAQMPQFMNTPGASVANVDFAGLGQQDFQNRMQKAAAKDAFWNNLISTGGQVAGAYLGGKG